MQNLKNKNGRRINLLWTQTDNTLTFHGVSESGEKTEGYIPLCYTAVGMPNHWMHFQSGQNTFSNNVVNNMLSEDEQLTCEYARDKHGFSGKIKLEFVADKCVLQENTLICHRENAVVTGLNSGVVNMFGFRRNETDRFEITYFNQAWQAEGQMKTVTFEEVSVGTPSDHPTSSTFRIDSVGTHTTARFYPLVFVYDKVRDETAFYQLFPLAEWFIEIGIRAAWTGDDCSVFINGGGFDERFSRYNERMSAGGEIKAGKCLYGVTKGRVKDAVKCLYKARRKIYSDSIEENAVAYYNDYLNCCWSNPMDEVSFPLARKAKELGFDFYVMDAGWFSDRNSAWDKSLGDWSFVSNRFDTGKLADFVTKVKALGIRFGIWTECEVCGENSLLFRRPDDWFLCEEGMRVGGGDRLFLDFTNGEVREYIENLYRKLKEIGVEYIKNDYNDSIFRAEKEGDRNHLSRSVTAFYNLMKKIREETGLAVEACSSGCMRGDPTVLGCFNHQSVSDQENLLFYPSIIKGSLYCALPEKLAVWGFHNPVYFRQFIGDKDFCQSDDFKKQCNDSGMLAFSLVNAMTGVLYFSGHINMNNAECDKIIEDAISVYRKIYPFLTRAYPVGESNDGCCELCGYDHLLFVNEEETEALVYVWRNGGAETCRIPSTFTKIEPVFAVNGGISAHIDTGKLVFTAKEKTTAAIFRAQRT